jgi:hypothetical protein
MGLLHRLFAIKQRPNIISHGNKIKVLIFAEPFTEAAVSMWDIIDFTPPRTLIQEADNAMKLDGMLVSLAGDSYSVDKMPRMTEEHRRKMIQQEAGSAKWMRYFGNTELILYNVVVILP